MWLCYTSLKCAFLALFFASDITCCVLYFRLWKCRFRQKANPSNFMSSKWIAKQQRQLERTMHLDQELLTNVQCSGGSRRWEPWRWGMEWPAISWSQLTTTNWKQSSKLVLLTTTWETVKELNFNHSVVLGIWSKLERWKISVKWVLHELTVNQKNRRYEESSSFIVCSNEEEFLNQIVTCDKKWILYNNQQWPAQSLDWEEAPKHFQSQTCIKTRSCSLFDGLLLVWSTSFLNPSETITSEKYVCSAN